MGTPNAVRKVGPHRPGFFVHASVRRRREQHCRYIHAGLVPSSLASFAQRVLSRPRRWPGTLWQEGSEQPSRPSMIRNAAGHDRGSLHLAYRAEADQPATRGGARGRKAVSHLGWMHRRTSVSRLRHSRYRSGRRRRVGDTGGRGGRSLCRPVHLPDEHEGITVLTAHWGTHPGSVT